MTFTCNGAFLNFAIVVVSVGSEYFSNHWIMYRHGFLYRKRFYMLKHNTKAVFFTFCQMSVASVYSVNFTMCVVCQNTLGNKLLI